MLSASPFRFLIIDDPVQAMDPSKVDGLARVLHEAALERQVVVFTHDDRLPEAVRRLQIPARHIQVVRRSNSQVEVRAVADPVERYFDDAHALLRADGLDSAVARRVIPGLCRSAIEFACSETVRRRRLQRGERHEDVEDALRQANGLRPTAALAIYDDSGRSNDVRGRLIQQFGNSAGDQFQLINQGAHQAVEFEPDEMIRFARRMAEWVRDLT